MYKSCYYLFILLPSKRFVIFTCRYFKLSWNTTAPSQSTRRNFSCRSITTKMLGFITGWVFTFARTVLITLIFVGFFNSFVSGHEPWDVNIIISFQGLKWGQQLGVACVRTPTPAINQSEPCVAGIFAMQSNTYYILCVVAFFVFEVR